MAKDTYRLHLIELVEGERSIWDINSDEYAMPLRKRQAWERIASAMRSYGHNTNVLEMKNAWRNIKDTRRKKSKQETGSSAKKNWSYADSLEFLDECEFRGESVTNFTEDCDFADYPLSDSPLQTPSSSTSSHRSTKSNATADEYLHRMKDAASRVQNVANRMDHERKDEDKYTSFGLWVGHHLRSIGGIEAQNRMNVIANVLLTSAPVELRIIPPQEVNQRAKDNMCLGAYEENKENYNFGE